MLVGKPAPDINCQAIIDNIIVDNVTWDNFSGKYKILFFYPLDFTFVCPTELHAFQETLDEFTKRNAIVLGISVDSVYSHEAWLRQPKNTGGIQGVTYPLLSDITKSISRAYNVLDEEKGIAYRGLFIIDKSNIVRCMQLNDLSLGRNIAEVLRLIDALEFVQEHGEVCPANWSLGKDGLKPTHAGVVDYFHKD